jgi:hypothetical protein
MKRLIAGLLWGLVVLWGGGYVALYLGISSVPSLPLAIAAGAFVSFDPFGRIWPSQAERVASSANVDLGLRHSA